jgi:hypothetical protein
MISNQKKIESALKDLDIESLTKYELISLQSSLLSFKIQTPILSRLAILITDKTPKDQPIPQIEVIQPKKNILFELPDLLVQKNSPESSPIKKQPLHQLKQQLFDNSTTEDSDSQQYQEDLTLLLEKQAKQLLFHTKEFNDIITSEKTERSDLQQHMDDSHDRFSTARKGIKKITQGTWTTTFMVWGSILASFLIFAFMYLYVRLFSIKRWDGNDEL